MTIAQNSPFDSLHFKSQKKFGFGQDLNNLQMKEKQRVDNTYRPNSTMKEKLGKWISIFFTLS